MNETITSLMERKSLRAFNDRAIGAAEKKTILQAAMAAPTAGNQQLYTILDITDPALKAKLAVSCDKQPFIAKAPLVLIFCADVQRWYDIYVEAQAQPRLPGMGDLMLAVSDANIAAQNAVTAGESMGIGSCYIGDIMENCEEHRELLSLPRYVFPAAMLVFGYPHPRLGERKKPERHALPDILQENGYQRRGASQLRDMMAKQAGDKGFDAWVQAFCQRKYNSAFAGEMNRSVSLYLQDYLPLEAEREEGEKEE